MVLMFHITRATSFALQMLPPQDHRLWRVLLPAVQKVHQAPKPSHVSGGQQHGGAQTLQPDHVRWDAPSFPYASALPSGSVHRSGRVLPLHGYSLRRSVLLPIRAVRDRHQPGDARVLPQGPVL